MNTPVGAGAYAAAVADGGDPGGGLARREAARVAGVVVLVVAACVFVFENLQPVTVHLWVTSRHTRLIWIIVVTLAAGILVGYLTAHLASRRQAGGRRPRRRI